VNRERTPPRYGSSTTSLHVAARVPVADVARSYQRNPVMADAHTQPFLVELDVE
jgi:hypothetical protein